MSNRACRDLASCSATGYRERYNASKVLMTNHTGGMGMNALNQDATESVSLSLLASFPAHVRDRLLADALRVDLPVGGMIYRDDDEPRCVLVINGLIRIFMTAPSGKEVTVRYARRGELLGLAAIVGGPAPVSVQLLTDASLLYLNGRILADIGRKEPGVAWLIAEDICHRLYDTLGVLAQTTFGSLRQQVARHLLDIATGQRNGTTLIARVSQQELADAVGSVRPAVARIIADLRDTGLITTSPRGITITDVAGLYEEVWEREVS